jgi:hypothetical protein
MSSSLSNVVLLSAIALVILLMLWLATFRNEGSGSTIPRRFW